MTLQQRWLIGFWALVALAGLGLTWSQNLLLMAPGVALPEAYPAFLEATKANPASRSITVDIGFFFMAAAPFMVIEARRLGLRFVWLYIVAGFLVAISVAFPLFMIARELKLRANTPNTAWRLTAGDVAGLVIVTAALAWLAWLVLT